MTYDAREARRSVEEPRSSAWHDWPGGPLVPAPPPDGGAAGHRWRRALLGATVAALIAAALWPRSAPVTDRRTGGAGLWNVELASSGARPVTALVFGEEAGVHLVRLPAAGATEEERRRIPVRLARGDVYMVSLGRPGLDVRSASPPGTPPMRFTARARFVKLFRDQRGTGVRTGWW